MPATVAVPLAVAVPACWQASADEDAVQVIDSAGSSAVFGHAVV